MKTSLLPTLAISLCLGASFANASDENNSAAIGNSILDEIGAWAMDEAEFLQHGENLARVRGLCDEMNEVVLPALNEMDVGHDFEADVRFKAFGTPYCDISTSFPMADWIQFNADDIDSSTPEKVADFIQRTLHFGEREKLAEFVNPALKLEY